MNRREALTRLTSVPAAAAAAAVSDAPGHWLDSWASQDIEAAIRSIDDALWQRFRSACHRLKRQRNARTRRERRANDVVVYRGLVSAYDYASLLTCGDESWRTVETRRREVLISTIGEDRAWEHMGEIIPLPVGTRLLVDSRISGAEPQVMCEIIDGAHGRRVHLWRASAQSAS